MEKVKIISMTGHRVGVTVPEMRFSRTWPAKGSAITVEKEILEDLMYDPGFKYMIESGMLYIEDLEVKKELGLEPEDAKEPVNIIVLSDEERRKYLTVYSFMAFKEKVSKLSYEQVMALADYAIENKLVDIDKCNYIKTICGRDIIRSIELKTQNEEA